MTFSDLAGQINIADTLSNAFNKNKLGHAYLFVDKNTTGALPLAVAFAQYIYCEKKSNTSTDSCGTCNACLSVQNLKHPDVHYTYPVINNKKTYEAPPLSVEFISEWQKFVTDTPYNNVVDWLSTINKENKQGNIFSNECSYIIKKLSLKSFGGGYKIQIIWMAEYLGKEGNKLLKLIEEPPEKTILILTTNNISAILPTIISRVQTVSLMPLINAELEGYLIRQNFDKDSIEMVLPFANGDIRKAIMLLNEDVGLNLKMLQGMLNALFVGKSNNHIEWINSLTKNGKEFIKQFLSYCLDVFQQAYVKYFIQSTNDTGNQQINLIQTIAQKIPLEQLMAMVTEIEKTIFYIDRNANDAMAMHVLLIKIKKIIKNQTQINVL